MLYGIDIFLLDGNTITVPAGEAAAAEPVNLTEVLTAERMIPLLADPAVQERLTPNLPQDASIPTRQDELKATVASPQFPPAVTTISSALASGQLGPVLAQFGLGEAAVTAANQGGNWFPSGIILLKYQTFLKHIGSSVFSDYDSNSGFLSSWYGGSVWFDELF